MNKTARLPDGTTIPALGLGTWRMGESASRRDGEVAAIRHAIDLGYRLFDTAEMYADGGAETLLGRALADALRTNAVRRDEVTIVDKCYPQHAGRRTMAAACDRSRERLGLDTIDVYLLHWRGAVPLDETVDAFEALVARGAIARWGVSNFDVDDLEELAAVRATGCATNQVYYALDERGAEFDLLPYQAGVGMPAMAYCPLGRGSLATDRTLAAIGAERGATAAQVALAWLWTRPGVIAIPKAADPAHLAANLAATDVVLDDAALAAIDAVFPPPEAKRPLAIV